jgi:hypothetical protein
VGYKFSLILSREISEDESVALKEAGCVSAVFGTDSLPTNADVTVTKMDFDDTVSPTLAEAIESALEAVKQVPDLSVPGLTVPAQPAGPVMEQPETIVGEVVEEPAEKVEESAEKKAGAKTASTKKAPARKPARKAAQAAAEPH